MALKPNINDREKDKFLQTTADETAVRTVLYDAAGNAGTLINGINYISGNSGIDASTESIQTISYEHHEIHAGSHFYYCDYQMGNASGAIINFVITTPNTTKWAHLVFDAYSSEGSTLEVYEGATGVVGGTSITPRNNNRNSLTASTMTLVKDPASIAGDGARAAGYLVGGTRAPGSESRDREIILKQNTTYLLRITSLANSNDISWCAEWYEHTDKN